MGIEAYIEEATSPARPSFVKPSQLHNLTTNSPPYLHPHASDRHKSCALTFFFLTPMSFFSKKLNTFAPSCFTIYAFSLSTCFCANSSRSLALKSRRCTIILPFSAPSIHISDFQFFGFRECYYAPCVISMICIGRPYRRKPPTTLCLAHCHRRHHLALEKVLVL